jgi:hypothetical protein
MFDFFGYGQQGQFPPQQQHNEPEQQDEEPGQGAQQGGWEHHVHGHNQVEQEA